MSEQEAKDIAGRLESFRQWIKDGKAGDEGHVYMLNPPQLHRDITDLMRLLCEEADRRRFIPLDLGE